LKICDFLKFKEAITLLLVNMSAFPPKSLQNTVKRRGKNTNNFGKPSKTDVFLIKNPFPMKKRLAFVFFKNKTQTATCLPSGSKKPELH